MTESAIPTRFYKISFWVIVTGLVTAALYLAALDRLLLGSAVLIVGCIPVGVLVLVVHRLEPPRRDAEKLATIRRITVVLVATGATAIVVGGVLMLALRGAVGHLPEALLWIGATLLLAGGTAHQETRARMRE